MAVSVLGGRHRMGAGLSTGQPDRTVKRLYVGACPCGTVGKRDLTHGAGAQGAHGVIPHPIRWDRRT
ncbi:hypothetical protein GCM10010394_58170 [Streptomyces crystallinus]|uniref:Uncharacterized protein n=1 Tax=Streptomyces crystallinus TaxID=68191 RepID=A0ABP3S2Q9_9ACTN